jgi:CheY-like chemotaxis protein
MNNVKRKVLIADDEPGVRRLLREILCGEYHVLEAQNGREAVDVAISEMPDLVLLDLIMPEMDGLTACRAIKDAPNTKEVPVVMVTAVTHELNKKLAENAAGASAYVTKPFSPKDVMATVSELLSGVERGRDHTKPDRTLIG